MKHNGNWLTISWHILTINWNTYFTLLNYVQATLNGTVFLISSGCMYTNSHQNTSWRFEEKNSQKRELRSSKFCLKLWIKIIHSYISFWIANISRKECRHFVVWQISNKNWTGRKATQSCWFSICKLENSVIVPKDVYPLGVLLCNLCP